MKDVDPVAREEGAFSFALIILAAGASRRMGQPKLLLSWGEWTVLGHLIRTWRRHQPRWVGLVTAPDRGDLLEEAKRHQVDDCLINPDPDRGMFSSIQCAARWDGWPTGVTHMVLSLGDQPQVQSDTYSRLLEWSRRHPEMICQPCRFGRSRHPVVLPRGIFQELAGSRADHLKAFLQERESLRSTFSSEDEGLDMDLDRPEDYEKAQAKFL